NHHSTNKMLAIIPYVRCRLTSAGQARALQRFHVRRLILVNAYAVQGGAPHGYDGGQFIAQNRHLPWGDSIRITPAPSGRTRQIRQVPSSPALRSRSVLRASWPTTCLMPERLRSPFLVRVPLFLRVALGIAIIISSSCDDVERTMTRGFGPATQSTSAPASAKEQTPEAEGLAKKSIYSDDDFVESEVNRDPFRSFTKLFRSAEQEAPQRTVVMSTTAIENMKLIAIISGVPAPKAMLVDPLGVGHVVERGMYLGRPEIVRASENVSMTLNWRVHRIRENEVVLTRADPTDPNRPPLTRVIPLRENEMVATR
ncbi:MAG: hypothetical protein JXA30_17475, partial [Deltaproteobacteria bacterium]|nr:hypothetical protein [Deltaproteobacteria bacterium]